MIEEDAGVDCATRRPPSEYLNVAAASYGNNFLMSLYTLELMRVNSFPYLTNSKSWKDIENDLLNVPERMEMLNLIK
ncbi:hypothetical protein GCM10028773_45870 [Spirosoma koreense]